MLFSSIELRVICVFLAVLAFAVVVGVFWGETDCERNEDAEKLWESIEEACDVSESDPIMEPVILPNGNLGYTISCEKKDN